MSASFCAYVRKMTNLMIFPLIGVSNKQIETNFFNTVKSAAEIMNTKLLIKDTAHPGNANLFSDRPLTVLEDDTLSDQYNEEKVSEQDWSVYMPIISPIDK